jgi:uncharacterized protein (DUF4213/DUF364 family)
MIRTKTKNNYLRIIEVYEYYIERENTDMKQIEKLMSNWDAINLFGTYSSLRRGVNKIKKKLPVGKKNFETQKKLFEIYKHTL